MTVMLALSIIGALLCVGVLLRRTVPFLRSNLVPATLLAALLGLILMNAGLPRLIDGLSADLLAVIVTELFTLSFISIALTGVDRPAGGTGEGSTRSLLTGAWGINMVWVLLFALTALVGSVVVLALSGTTDMDPLYGLLVPFGFAQGPGQAATFGAIIEDMGWENGTSVALTFAAVGFLAAFLGGVPLARLGMRVGLGRSTGTLSPAVARGYFRPGEQTESAGKITTSAGSIDTLAMHVAIMGVCYLLARGLAALLALIPGFVGDTLAGMMFINGMIAAYVVRFLMTKLGIVHLIDNGVQSRITGLTSDFLIVASFMAVQVAVVGAWLVPILVEAVVIMVLTAAVVLFFGQRLGSGHDFERTLGLYGTATGTVPSGIALIRIVDPRMRTTAIQELGMMNLGAGFLYLPVMLLISAAFGGALGYPAALGLIAACVVGYLLLMLVTRVVKPRTYSLRTGSLLPEPDVDGATGPAGATAAPAGRRDEAYEGAGPAGG